MIYIGIDPDTEKSGVAQRVSSCPEEGVQLMNYTYMELFDYLKTIKKISTKDLHEGVLVVIEKGEQNKAIFNAHKAKNKQIAAKIGVSVGRNFECTNIIEQFCKYLELDYEFYKPSFKKFDNKFAQQQFNLNVKRTNEEQRDALRCIMKYIL
jgi:hypothetical protein